MRRDLVLRRSRVAGQDIHCGLGTIVTTDMINESALLSMEGRILEVGPE